MSQLIPAAPSRLAYIDWMRGLACALMFQTHCYDSWLSPSARQSRFFMYSQLGGTFPAPLFLFLAGISFALVTEKLWKKDLLTAQIARATIRRGAEIFAFGLLFRLQEYVIAWGWAPLSDLLRVDVLNTIGLSMMLMGLLCWLVLSIHREAQARLALVLASAGTALLISLFTPPLWTTWRPRWLVWPLESYINGVHNFGSPTPWIFSIFPWCGFAFVGLAFGSFLFSDFAQRKEVAALSIVGAIGALACALSLWWDYSNVRIYAVYDYWHSSPNFFLMRCGILLLLTLAIFAWCRWGWGAEGFSPFIQFGKTSLLVYWVHIEFVYGRLSILPKGRSSIPLATMGMIVIFAAMLGMSIWRTRAKKRAALNLQTTTAQSLSEAM